MSSPRSDAIARVFLGVRFLGKLRLFLCPPPSTNICCRGIHRPFVSRRPPASPRRCDGVTPMRCGRSFTSGRDKRSAIRSQCDAKLLRINLKITALVDGREGL